MKLHPSLLPPSQRSNTVLNKTVDNNKVQNRIAIDLVRNGPEPKSPITDMKYE